MSRATRARRLDMPEFISLLELALDVPPGHLHPDARFVRDVHVDELSLVQVVLAIQEVNPYFDLPSQIDVSEVTIADLHHFHSVMGAGHVEVPGGRP